MASKHVTTEESRAMHDMNMNADQLAEKFGVYRTTIYRWARTPGFPEGMKRRGKARVWNSEAVKVWVDALVASGPQLGKDLGVPITVSVVKELQKRHAFETMSSPNTSDADFKKAAIAVAYLQELEISQLRLDIKELRKIKETSNA